MRTTALGDSGASDRESPLPAAEPPPTMAAVFEAQYRSLVRLAAMLLDDAHAAEDMAQEAYIRVASRHVRLRDPHKALAYLRQTVVNLCRSANRRRSLARRHSTFDAPHVASAEDGAIELFERQAVVRGLRGLPRRHREALVLRFYLDLTVEQTAEALGVSSGAVKAYTSRGIDQLRRHLLEDGKEVR